MTATDRLILLLVALFLVLAYEVDQWRQERWIERHQVEHTSLTSVR